MSTAPAERLGALCAEFRLPTLAAELVPRLVAAGHEDLVPLVADIFELEAGDRRERRVDRLRRASRLPPGKTLATLDQARLPRALAQHLRDLARGETSAVPIPAWASAPPVAHGGKLWWWGYDYLVGNYAFNGYDRATGLIESGLATYLQEPSSYSASALANLARRQPFVVSDDGI